MNKTKQKIKTARTEIRRLLNISDKGRWQNNKNLHQNWDERTKLIGEMIPTHGTVLEFGAGKMILKKYLSQRGQTYVASDIVKRYPETVVLDLNSYDPKRIPKHDIAVFSGVLEYVTNLHKLIFILSDLNQTIIASYTTLEQNPDIHSRRQSGWYNDLTEKMFTKMFTEAGYLLTETKQWKNQTLFSFTKLNESFH